MVACIKWAFLFCRYICGVSYIIGRPSSGVSHGILFSHSSEVSFSILRLSECVVSVRMQLDAQCILAFLFRRVARLYEKGATPPIRVSSRFAMFLPQCAARAIVFFAMRINMRIP